MKNLFKNFEFKTMLTNLSDWFANNIFEATTAIQITVIVVLFLVARLLAKQFKRIINVRQSARLSSPKSNSFLDNNIKLLEPGLLTLFLLVMAMGGESTQLPHRVLSIAASILLAWIAIQLASQVVKNTFWRNAIAGIAWSIAVFNILGIWEPIVHFLDGLDFSVGGVKFSVYRILKSGITLAVLLWLATIFTTLFERKILSSKTFTPSMQVLSTKLLKILLVIIAIFISLSGAGIDFTAFAVFSGAIGVGIGFGLQKIVSNLISGVILLLDKSIKPGDVIAIPGYYGQVNSLGARYVSVLTRDGIEHLIPNEELIVNRVENWSYSHNKIRLRLEVGVHYKSNVEGAIQLCIQACQETPRVLRDPKSVCILRGFGDNSVNLEIRFWIDDPMNGRANVKSEILLKVWKKFHENNIEIPYPQRDLHLRSSDLENPFGNILNNPTG